MRKLTRSLAVPLILSSVAASMMRADGFANVSDLIGGYTAWAQAQDAA